MPPPVFPWPFACLLCAITSIVVAHADDLQRLNYNDPNLTVDLGVGLYAFPIPFDYDNDGDLDLLAACTDKPSRGVYYFENKTGKKGAGAMILAAPKYLGPGAQYITLSWIGKTPRILAANREFNNFVNGDWQSTRLVFPKDRVAPIKNLRSNTWRFIDYDGDGVSDLLIGHDSWDDFGWFDTNDWWRFYDAQGKWNGGDLDGRVYWVRNAGSDDSPKWEDAQPILAGGRIARTYGAPTPNLADFDNDGDLDLLCGEFLDGFSYFENQGTRREPKFAAARRLPFTMDLQMIVPVAVDWDGDGDVDILCGDEDGRIAFIENSGVVKDGLPAFKSPVYLKQEASEIDAGALATPVAIDWDNDGDTDLLCGNTAGYILYFENLSGAGVENPRFAAPKYVEAGGTTLRIMAGPNGSIQGPAESKWGYTTLSAADWDGDGLTDLIVNSILGKVVWYRNTGTRSVPRLAPAQMVEVAWEGEPPKTQFAWWKPAPRELATQWRTTPVAIDLNKDRKVDLVMLDHEGWLAFFERRADGALSPGKRILCDEKGEPLQLNGSVGGRSGRRKLTLADWDGDGVLDLLLNGKNAEFWRGLGQIDGKWRFQKVGDVSPRNIEGHDTSPTIVDWNSDQVPDLVIGAEDGKLYYLRNPRSR